MMDVRPKVFLFSTFKTTFIDDDVRLLSQFSELKWICSSGLSAIGRIKWSMLACKVGIAWFASVYSALLVFMARLFRKKSIIIVGGADVVTDRHLGYGLLLSQWKRPFVRYALRKATHVLPTSEYLRRSVVDVIGDECEHLHTLFLGLDRNFWRPASEKESLVLSVAHCISPDRMLIKGIDMLFQVAKEVRDIPFQIIGVDREILSQSQFSVPQNVHVLRPIPREELLPFYQRATVYCQLSRRESVGIAAAEAMLCGCIPIVSDVGGLPETVGDTGYLVPSEDIRRTAEAVRQALAKSDGSAAEACRNRIVETFSIERRLSALKEMVLS